MASDDVKTLEILIDDHVYYNNKPSNVIDETFNEKLLQFEKRIDMLEFHKLVLEITLEMIDTYNLTLFKPAQLANSAYYNFLARALQIMRYIRENKYYVKDTMWTFLKLTYTAMYEHYPILNKLGDACYVYNKYYHIDFNVHVAEKILAFCINNQDKFDESAESNHIFSKPPIVYNHYNHHGYNYNGYNHHNHYGYNHNNYYGTNGYANNYQSQYHNPVINAAKQKSALLDGDEYDPYNPHGSSFL